MFPGRDDEPAIRRIADAITGGTADIDAAIAGIAHAAKASAMRAIRVSGRKKAATVMERLMRACADDLQLDDLLEDTAEEGDLRAAAGRSGPPGFSA